MPRSRLTEAFLEACDPDVTKTLDAATVEDMIPRHLANAKRAWPSFKVDDVRFVTHLAGRMRPDVDAEKGIRDVHAADLYLALACSLGDKRALAELEKLFELLPEALARLASRAPVDEVVQAVRTKLLVAEKGEPKILDYAGRGPLGGWLRVTAVRTALSMARKTNPAAGVPVTREILLAVPDFTDDPELAHFRDRYKTEFKSAFEQAVAALEPRERNLLRLSLVDGLNIDQIGVVFGVHRATAARWIQKSIENVQSGTRERLVERLRMSEAELESLMGVLRSSLELSIQRLLV